MTLDELWRLDLARQPAPTNSGAETEEVAPVGDSASSGFGPDDLDEEEVNRFLEWLEKCLPLT